MKNPRYTVDEIRSRIARIAWSARWASSNSCGTSSPQSATAA
jgi:hypothetical protein